VGGDRLRREHGAAPLAASAAPASRACGDAASVRGWNIGACVPGDGLDRHPTRDPCVLVVGFRLRAVRGWGHAAFRAESLLNTPFLPASRALSPNCGWPTISVAVTGPVRVG
jgi:hypothetical protein